jgi:hypothetical protein
MPDEPAKPFGVTENNSTDATTERAATFGDLQTKISDDVAAATDAVKESADTAMQKVQETVAEQAGFAARQAGGIATALQKVGAELENGEQAEIGRYAKQIGDSVQAIAKNMEGKDLGEIAGMAEDFGRKQPLAFMGVAALAGLAASRFLTASAKRKPDTTNRPSTVDARSQGGSSSTMTGGSING